MLGDGIRRNIKDVDPTERAALRDAILELNRRYYLGDRTDTPPGGVSWWFKQDEIHQATHVHGGPEFLPWHREAVNRFEALIRQINPQLSLHYWNWTEDPRAIPNANLGGGMFGTLNLFTPDFMGYGGAVPQPIGPPWQNAAAPFRNDGFYVPGASPNRDSADGTAADPPDSVYRSVNGSPFAVADDDAVLAKTNYAAMRSPIDGLENLHNLAHGFVNMGNQHISFRDPFVFLLHSNVDRIFARWQTDPIDPGRLNPTTVYGAELTTPESIPNPFGPGTIVQDLTADLVEPWSTGHGHFNDIRPWEATHEHQGVPHHYTDISVVTPPCYDTNHILIKALEAENPLDTSVVPNRHKVNFNDVPDTETTWRAAIIRIFACTDITLNVVENAAAIAPFTVITGMPFITHPGPELYVDAKIWFQYTAPAPSAPPAAHIITPVNVTLHCAETNQDFLFELTGNTIPQETVAVELVLDQTGSMSLPAGTSGATRLQVLKSAAHVFAQYLPANNGIGITRFDDVAYPPNDPTYGGMVITPIASNNMNDATRMTASTVIDAHGAHGNTSIGAGLIMGQSELNSPAAAGFTHRALVILTDGIENRAPYINQVLVDSKTYAVGLGNELQVDTGKLFAIAGGTGGYLLLTGTLSPGTDDFFRLRKFFLQISAHVSNTSIVTDPSGYISPGTRIKIPFNLSEADINCRVILLSDFNVIDMSLETPDGKLINTANAAGFGVTFDSADKIKESRFGLPIAFQANKIQQGTWYVILEIDKNNYKSALAEGDSKNRPNRAELINLRTKGAQYCVSVHSLSNLKMNATINQNGFIPGSTMSLKVVLTEYNLPVEHRASVKAELEYPDHSATIISFTEEGQGVFTTSLVGVMAGIYRFRIIAEGGSYHGSAFSREQLLNGAVYHEIGNPPGNTGSGSGSGDLCSVLNCLLNDRGIEGYLKERNINPKTILKCIEEKCRK